MDQPNVVLVNCDDLGYGDLGCYVSTRNATPVLDQMAAEGLRFDDFYMASPVCSPSRGALLTGCYPSRIGFGDFDGLPVLFPGQGVGLSPSEISIGRLLSSAGYGTQIIGKWHCGDQPAFLPTNHGFDGCFGIPYSNDMGRQVGTRTRPDGEQPGYPPLPLLRDGSVVEQQPDQVPLTARYVDAAVQFSVTPVIARSSSTWPTSTCTCRSTCRSDSPSGRATVDTAPRSRRSTGRPARCSTSSAISDWRSARSSCSPVTTARWLAAVAAATRRCAGRRAPPGRAG